jgi:glycosyltransferase involved in cell wall biosynthesis
VTVIHPLHFGKLLPPPFAGVEAHIDQLLRALQPEVQGTLLACSADSEPAIRQRGLPYRTLVKRFHGRIASAPVAPGMMLEVQRELSSGRSNLLHLHAPNPMGDVSGLLFGTKAPLVLSWHSDIVKQRALLRLYGPVQRSVIDRADAIIVFTPAHYEHSLQLKRPGVERKLHVVPMGFDFSRLAADHADAAMTAQLARFADGRPMLLSVGRHVYYKGYEFLLSAFAKLRQDAVLVMVGTGPLGQVLRSQAESLGVQHRIWFTGEVTESELVSAYRSCDVFTLPSVEPSEAFGMASAEAMACGKPTVVCDLGNGVNYLNQKGRTSLTVAPRDVRALAEALQTLIEDATLRKSMGEEANRWVRSTFSADAMRAAHIDLYRRLLG